MSSWKKYFSAVPTQARLQQRLKDQSSEGGAAGHGSSAKFNSFLPEVYSGAPNRVERYIQYEQMDLDSEISKALDTIADFSTQNYEISEEPFTFNYKGKLTETEITLLKETMSQWCSLNKWQQRLWRMFRNTIKYGDQIFIRDPETFKLIWVDPTKVEKLIVNESKGKEIEQYVIKDMDLNLTTLVGTNMLVHDQYSFPGGYPRSSNPAAGSGTINYGQSNSPGSRNSRFDNMPNQAAINAEHILHLSLSEGLDNQWPFGTSILESIYKVYKQKDLLEDAILIYRIVRAPERRVFYIDVGSLSGPRAMQYVERIKNEIYQRRIPNRTGGGQCITLDTLIPLLDGRNLPLNEIIHEYNSGKQNWVYSVNPQTGEIVPGPITWAGVTRKQTQVMKLTFDNDESIICTPDHKFPILGQLTPVMAKDLVLGQSMIPAYFDKHHINKNCTDDIYTYTRIFDLKLKNWKFVHRLVATYFKNHTNKTFYNEFQYDISKVYDRKNTIHHVDFNRYNNNPNNLTWMNSADHINYHSDNIPRIIYDKKLFDIMLNIVVNSNTNKTFSRIIAAKELESDSEFMSYYKLSNIGYTRPHKLTKFSRANLSNLIKSNGYKNWTVFQRELIKKNNLVKDYSLYRFSNLLFDIFKETYQATNEVSLPKIITKLKTDIDFVNEFNKLHSQLRVTKQYKISYAYVRAMLIHYGYSSFRSFVKNNRSINYVFKNRKTLTKYSFNQKMFDIFRSHYTKKVNNLHYTQKHVGFTNLYQTVQQDSIFINEFNKENPASNKNRFGPDLLKQMIKSFNFKNYEDFREKSKFLNHKLVKIEYLDELIDTGTITVDGNEELHNYHNFALASGVFTCNSVIDAAYNPISINEDYFLATNAEGKGTKIDTLGGGENLGQIDDLKYFNNKMIRGLGVPSSYLPTGADDGTTAYTDGKVGTAYVQEYRFSKYCQRLQNLMAPHLDKEFKMFLKQRGIEIQSNLFEVQFFPPQSFSQYRQIQVDTEQVGLFSNLMGTEASKYVSKRFALERYLGWTEDEILKNEKLWKEENAKKVKDKIGSTPNGDENIGLGGVGIRSAPSDIMSDFGGGEELPGEEPGGPPTGGGEQPAGVGLSTAGTPSTSSTAGPAGAV